MSVIQKALEKAQAKVEDMGNESKVKAEAINEVKDFNYSPEPIIQRKTQPILSTRKILTVAALIPLTIVIFFYAGRFLSKLHGWMLSGARTEAQDVVYKPLVKSVSKGSGAILNASAGILTMPENPRLILNGIMHMEDGPKAIINNMIVGVGDSIGGAKVSKINRQNAILEYGNVEITLNLK